MRCIMLRDEIGVLTLFLINYSMGTYKGCRCHVYAQDHIVVGDETNSRYFKIL